MSRCPTRETLPMPLQFLGVEVCTGVAEGGAHSTPRHTAMRRHGSRHWGMTSLQQEDSLVDHPGVLGGVVAVPPVALALEGFPVDDLHLLVRRDVLVGPPSAWTSGSGVRVQDAGCRFQVSGQGQGQSQGQRSGLVSGSGSGSPLTRFRSKQSFVLWDIEPQLRRSRHGVMGPITKIQHASPAHNRICRGADTARHAPPAHTGSPQGRRHSMGSETASMGGVAIELAMRVQV